ncbi:MAG TPA: DUF1579 family protein [Burkholderiaceae bacterium]|nr:DUF1579 family protein [Burkholderiaceae bacterium]
MRAATLIATLTLIAQMAGSAHAQNKPGEGSAPPALKPAAELERLKAIEGIWSCTGVTPAGSMGPGSPETKYTSTFTIKPISNGFAYTVAYDQKGATGTYSGAWSAAWDGAQKKLVLFWLDSVGNVGVETAGDWKADVLIAQGEGYVPAGFVPVALSGKALFRDTFTRKGDKGLHWKGELKLHGMKTWTVIGIDDCSKT